MRKLGFSGVIKEIVLPLVISALITWYMLYKAVTDIKRIKFFKRNGITAPAKVMDYNMLKCGSGRTRYHKYNVTVECKPPGSDNEEMYFLSTTSGRARRYKKLKETEVVFMSRDESIPILVEELHLIRREIFAALLGGVICGLFCALLLIAVADDLSGGVIRNFLHKLFSEKILKST